MSQTEHRSVRLGQCRRRRGIRGIALLEALVGILIFAFGVLGLIGLQASMTRAQTGAKVRADAANLANELAGIMWSDASTNLSSYITANCGNYTRCKDWKAKVASELPSATVAVSIVNAGTGEVLIQLGWTVPNEGTHQFSGRYWIQP